MESKKVLLLGNCYYTIFRFRKELVEKLVGEGYEVWAAFPNHSHGEKETGEETSAKLGCHFVELKMDRRSINPLSEVKLLSSVYKLVKTIKPDVIMLYTIKLNIYGGIVARWLKIPYSVNITGLGSGLNKGGIIKKVLLKMYLKSLNHASKVFFQNRNDINYFDKAGYKKNNYELLPGSGVNLNEFGLLDYPMESGVKFLYIARVMKEKGIEEFIAAAKHFGQEESVEFHICGDCEEEYKEKMEELESQKIMYYHGQVSDVKKYIEKSGCVVLPSFYNEGISNSLLEAAACGRPIITTKHPGCEETIVDGISGFLVNKKDSEDLIKAIDRMVHLSCDERKKMGLAGRQHVEENYDREKVVNSYLSWLQALSV